MREDPYEPTRPALALRLLPPLVFLLLLLPLRFVALGAVERELNAELDDRARALAAALAAAAREPLASGSVGGEHDAQALLRDLLGPETSLAWGAVLLVDGHTPLGVERSGARAPDLAGAVPADGLVHDAAGLVNVRLPVRGMVGAAGAPDVEAANLLPPELPVKKLLGYVHVALARDGVERRVGELARVLDAGLALGSLLLLGLSLIFTGRWVTRPLEDSALAARALAAGDLTAVPPDAGDPLSGSLHRLGSSLRETLDQLRGVAEGLASVIARMSRTGERVSSGARATRTAAETTSASLGEIAGSVGGIAENVEVLARAAEESSASILTMAATNDEVAGNVRALAGSVEETTAAIERMARAIQEVARSVEELAATAESTSSSMRDMDVAIVQVETNASETARLSEQVSTDAATGMVALQKTLTGIDNIKDSSRTAADVIESLGRRIGSIGNVLNVIDDVAEQTNLLALNAAIIAAQAGEHGKGFAVVADEIKDLAERTGSSTKEIAELIRSVQNESKNAISAMDRGVRNVEEGVRLGGEAESALRKIQDSAAKSTQMIRAIARATVEQSRGSRQVTSSITRIAETVQQIAASTGEQARGSEQIMKSAERMRQITGAVTRSSDEQARGSRQITRSIESISEMVNQLQRAQGEQMRGSERAQRSAAGVRDVAEELLASVQELEAAIVALSGQADVLRAGLARFRT